MWRDSDAMAARSAAAANRGSWTRDPSGRYEYRFWDGTDWTAWVSHHGDLGVDLDTDPARLEPPGAVRRDRPRTRPAVASAVMGLATSLVALVVVHSGRGSTGSRGAFYAQLGATLVIEFAAMTAIALAIGALVAGTRAWIQNHRKHRSSRSNVFVFGAGGATLVIAISALTRI